MGIVVYIRSDPFKSHRPCEGIRIALGLAACNHTVTLILANKAPILLTDHLEDCIDAETAKIYLATLPRFIPAFFIEKGNEADLTQAPYTTTFWSKQEIAEAVAKTGCFLLF